MVFQGFIVLLSAQKINHSDTKSKTQRAISASNMRQKNKLVILAEPGDSVALW